MKPKFWIEDRMLQAKNLEPGNLEHSILKWEFIVAHFDDLDYDGSCNTCALCLKYEDCKCCPVYEYTDKHFGCARTPYMLYAINMKEGDRESAYKHAQEEIDFLISLRDKK